MQRLVVHQNPEGRNTPILLLTELRTLDPTMEVVYVGERWWWVGRVDKTDVRRDKGLLMLKQLDALDEVHKDRPSVQRSITYARLLTQGFARIEMYRDCGDPSGEVEVQWFDGITPKFYRTTILNDITERFAAFERDGGEAAVAKRMRLTDGTAEKDDSDANFREYLVNDGLSHYRREVRNRVQFGHGGMTGGQGKMLVHL